MYNGFRNKRSGAVLLIGAAAVWIAVETMAFGVSSKIVRHNSGSELLKGKTEDVIISSRGAMQLGRDSELLIDAFEDVWSINSVVVTGGTVYVGTSPNGGIYQLSLGKVKRIYPAEDEQGAVENADVNDANGAPEKIANEHIFAMTTDVAGRLIAGISGARCMVCRFEGERMEVILEPNDAQYIFAIALDDGGNMYVGTGPEGKIYQCDPLGEKCQVVYDCVDKNILSLTAGDDGFLYAGSDGRGLVYKIDPKTQEASVLYDSDQPEIAALLPAQDGALYAAGTSAQVVQTQTQFAAQVPQSGRPETPTANGQTSAGNGGKNLKIPNTEQPTPAKQANRQSPVPKGSRPDKASVIYKIDSQGFVTDIFSEAVVFFSLVPHKGQLLLGTGNNAQLYTLDPVSDEQAVIYEDKQASQITSVAVDGDDMYLGMANPAKLVKIGRKHAAEGTYISDLIDAGQPAHWGKLQIEADIPERSEVLMSCRSGNVQDVNDPTFSEWTKPVKVTNPVPLECPLGRFCQYKLIFRSKGGQESPVVREVALASTVPNLAPEVEAVGVTRLTGSGKDGFFKIDVKAEDDNGDKLTYTIDFRKLGRSGWIELTDDLEQPSFEWDGRTVEEGRYELRITASDEKGNSSMTQLTGSRISEPVIVDNSGPVVSDLKVRSMLDNAGPAKVITCTVKDQWSVVADLQYTIDSNSEWTGGLPDDLVYDTTEEDFTIRIPAEDLPSGDHVVSIKVSDIAGNTTYKTHELTVE